jgi:type I site-specific restriction endonuclease
LTKNENSAYFFDSIRQKMILLTPEEKVRQQIIALLVDKHNVPKGLISVEKRLNINGLTKRYDVLVHDRMGKPLLLVECKAPQIKLSQSTIDQVARYNIALNVPWLLVTNGIDIYCVRMEYEQKTFKFESEIPMYEAM